MTLKEIKARVEELEAIPIQAAQVTLRLSDLRTEAGKAYLTGRMPSEEERELYASLVMRIAFLKHRIPLNWPKPLPMEERIESAHDLAAGPLEGYECRQDASYTNG
jgi:hypothetical protein